MQRQLTPEQLDHLPSNDPRAVRSRHDLRRVNSVMRQSGIMYRLFREHVSRPPGRIIELGGGDADFMLKLARRTGWQDVELIIADRQDVVDDETRRNLARSQWRLRIFAEDVFAFLERGISGDLICANLFLHHFAADEIRLMFGGVCRLAPAFLACEPRRTRFAFAASHCIGAMGGNSVTRHDAVASVVAGFRDRELTALWPDAEDWRLHEHGAAPFTHCFAAVRAV